MQTYFEKLNLKIPTYEGENTDKYRVECPVIVSDIANRAVPGLGGHHLGGVNSLNL